MEDAVATAEESVSMIHTVRSFAAESTEERKSRRALDRLDKIAKALRDDFRTYQGEEIEFNKAWINDSVADEPTALRANVIADYSYRQFI